MTRTEFAIVDPQQIDDLVLQVKYDDAYVAYLNGTEVARKGVTDDPSWDKGYGNHSNDAAIVSATIALAHNLRLRVVAEGVEEQVQAEILRSQGCDEAQGYWFSRPLPVEAFAAWVQAWIPGVGAGIIRPPAAEGGRPATPFPPSA